MLARFVASSCRSAARTSRARIAPLKPAYFVLARGQKARPLAPPQYGGRRDPSCVFLPYSPNSLASEILFAQHIETAECRGRVAYP